MRKKRGWNEPVGDPFSIPRGYALLRDGAVVRDGDIVLWEEVPGCPMAWWRADGSIGERVGHHPEPEILAVARRKARPARRGGGR